MNDQELLVTLTEDIFKELNCSLQAEHCYNNNWDFTAYIGTTQDIIYQPWFYKQFIVSLNTEKKTIKIEGQDPLCLEDPELFNKLQLRINSIICN